MYANRFDCVVKDASLAGMVIKSLPQNKYSPSTQPFLPVLWMSSTLP
jgi:hypothetical protein